MIAPFQGLKSTGRIVGSGGFQGTVVKAAALRVPVHLRRRRLYVGFYYDSTSATISTENQVSISVRFGEERQEGLSFGWQVAQTLNVGLPNPAFDDSAIVPTVAVETIGATPPAFPTVTPFTPDDMIALAGINNSGAVYLRMAPIPIFSDAAEIEAEFRFSLDSDPSVSFIGFLGVRADAA